jgi:hypothetical protein
MEAAEIPADPAVNAEDAEVTTEEAWATAEGYTPLADMTTEGAMFMSFQPDDDDNPCGAIFADMTAFGPPDNCDWDDDDSEESEEQQVGDEDFRFVADQALEALEMEYSTTIGTVPHKATEEVFDDQKVAASIRPSDALEMDQESSEKVPSETQLSQPIVVPKKEHPPIDADAVRRAVDSIRLKAPRLTTALNNWEQQHGTVAPHPIIPKAPLSAFVRQSSKAISATANLSRSATLAEAVHRLSCLGSERLVIHIVGADHVECDHLQTTFGPLVRWIGALENSPKHINIHLIGPNVSAEAAKRPPADLLPKSTSRLVSASATCHESVYHEWIQQHHRPDVAAAFNAGIWGYNEWVPTIKALCESSNEVPFVATSYSIQECEDDADVIEQAAQDSTAQCLWKAEVNPFGSKQDRETVTAVAGRVYRENAAWQAWRFGGG